jgi:hypothetical protein
VAEVIALDDENVSFELYTSWNLLRLWGIDLREMDLRDYDLSWIDLMEAKLNGADLRGANLSHSTLISTNLTGADLRGANLENASLHHAFLCGALIEKKSLDAALDVEIPSWQQKDLTGAFTGLDSLSLDAWGAIVQFYQRHCAYCGGPYEIIDHFLPRSQGGATWVGNVVPACFACWSAKGDRRRPDDRVIPPEVMEHIAFDLQQRAEAEPMQ